MRAQEIITEYHGGAWRFIRDLVPDHWPDYVVKDWFYRRSGRPQDYKTLGTWIRSVIEDYPVRRWRLETRVLALDSFDLSTQRILTQKMRDEDPIGHTIRRNAERHATQADIIKRTGRPNQEPVIAIDRDGKLELQEGWHRTTQNLLAFPNGYQGRVWVGYI